MDSEIKASTPEELAAEGAGKIQDGVKFLKHLQGKVKRSEGARILAIAITDLEKATWALEKVGALEFHDQ